MNQPLRFHWSLSQAGDKFRRAQSANEQRGLPSLEAQVELCRCAEESGIESMLMAIGFSRPDPMLLSVRIGMVTEKIKFMVACRSGLISPTFFVQQINTVSALIQGRVCINMVCGHTPHELQYYGDFLSHDDRYERTDEFLSVCRAFWQRNGDVNFHGKYFHIQDGKINTPFLSAERTSPEIFLGGNSQLAGTLAVKHASCLWCFADTPANLLPRIQPILEQGTEVGLLVSLLARATRKEAVDTAYSLIQPFGADVRKVHEQFAQRSDSEGFRATYAHAKDNASSWLTPCLWAGAVPYLGAPAIALVGSYEEVAAVIVDYKRIGISQFLFMGWPDIDEMTIFGEEVLPLIRRKEGKGQVEGLREKTYAAL
jgi:alkanesulfonate monooxygenase